MLIQKSIFEAKITYGVLVTRKFKINSEMMNLIGCNKESFYNLMLSMNYKKGNEVDTYFYVGKSKKKLEALLASL